MQLLWYDSYVLNKLYSIKEKVENSSAQPRYQISIFKSKVKLGNYSKIIIGLFSSCNINVLLVPPSMQNKGVTFC